MCIEFAAHVPKIRELLHLTQQRFGAMCGISTDRLSRIENEHAVMTWSQFTSMLMLCMLNFDTKEYICANNVVPVKLFQYFQQKDENIPPAINIGIREDIIKKYIQSEE